MMNRPTSPVEIDDAIAADDVAARSNTTAADGAGTVAARRQTWKDENATAVASYNRWVANHGLPLETWRQF